MAQDRWVSQDLWAAQDPWGPACLGHQGLALYLGLARESALGLAQAWGRGQWDPCRWACRIITVQQGLDPCLVLAAIPWVLAQGHQVRQVPLAQGSAARCIGRQVPWFMPGPGMMGPPRPVGFPGPPPPGPMGMGSMPRPPGMPPGGPRMAAPRMGTWTASSTARRYAIAQKQKSAEVWSCTLTCMLRDGRHGTAAYICHTGEGQETV